MSNEGCVTWLKYFVDVVKPTKEETIVLIFDGHVTHTKNLVSIEIALEAGVVMVSLPPHTTYRLQPLGVAFVGPFGKYYDDALRMWMREDVGRPVTWQVAEILNVAYGKAASIQNAVRGFRKTGQWPLTIDLFQDSDFAVAMVTYLTGQWCVILYIDEIYPGIMRRVMDATKNTGGAVRADCGTEKVPIASEG